MRWVVIVALALFSGCTSHAQTQAKEQPYRGPQYPSAARPFPEEKITYEQWQSFFNDKLTDKNAEIHEADSAVVINISPAVYVFTKPSNPAHPAVDIMIYSSDRTRMIRTGNYAGSEEAFNEWRRLHKY